MERKSGAVVDLVVFDANGVTQVRGTNRLVVYGRTIPREGVHSLFSARKLI